MKRPAIAAVGLALQVVCGAVASLASPHADHITGEAVGADGGLVRR